MIQRFVNVITNAGIDSKMSGSLASNLRTTVIVNVILAPTILLFIVLFFIVARGMVPLAVIPLIATFASMFFLFLRYHRLARIITSSIVCCTAVVIHSVVSTQLGTSVAGLYAACALVSLLPWFLFSLSELAFASISFALNIIAILFGAELFANVQVDSDVTMIAHPLLQKLLMFFGALCISATTIALKMINATEARKVRQLLEKVEHDNKRAHENQNELNILVDKLKSAQLEEEKRIWASKGLAETARILRDESDLAKLCDKLIAFLVKYLACNQGAMFLLEDHKQGSHFTLSGCYAYDRKKFIDKKIQPGEGLIGQVYYEKNYIYITQVPKNYTHITSGLGEATPRSVLIVPMLALDTISGAFEFASFTEFEKYKIDFLMEVGENTALTFAGIKSNEQTKELLKETQLMTAQMKEQEEEMRQNMEELAATQEQQSRTENQLRQELEEKENTIASLTRKLLTTEVTV